MEFFVTGGTYHIFNRFIHHYPYFDDKKTCDNFLNIMNYYLQAEPPVRYSLYKPQKKIFTLDYNHKIVTILNYSLMPTHFHITLNQELENGIRTYMQKISNSLSHYINTINDSKGPIFESTFKAVRVETNEQLIHLSRYIHLNPTSSGLVKRPEDYPYSSYRIYLGLEKSEFIDPSLILSSFKLPGAYERFVLDNLDYQKSLERLKYLTFE
jgi:putative transposase